MYAPATEPIPGYFSSYFNTKDFHHELFRQLLSKLNCVAAITVTEINLWSSKNTSSWIHSLAVCRLDHICVCVTVCV
jgi:hypothetical protein